MPLVFRRDKEPLLSQYRKIAIMSPGLIFVEKDFLLGIFSRELNFGGAYYWREFFVSKGVCLDNKNISKNDENRLKQLKTANPNSRWADIRRGFFIDRKDICV